MRIQSSVTSISWIPSEAVEGLPKLPFTMGVAHYDYPPPDRIDHLETMHRADLFREANELRAWIEVEDGKISDYGQTGRGRIGLTRLKLGPKEIAVPAVAMPTLQNAEVGDGWVRFTQTAGGRTGMPAPRSVRGKGGDGKPRPQALASGDILVEQGDTSEGSPVVYLVLDGVLEVVVDGEVVGELGPGAIVGERAQLEGGARTATLRAKTAGKVVGIPGEELNPEALEQVAVGHRREDG